MRPSRADAEHGWTLAEPDGRAERLGERLAWFVARGQRGRRHRVFVFDRGFAVVAGRRVTERTWSELALICVGVYRTETFRGAGSPSEPPVADAGSVYIADAFHGRWETADGLRLTFRLREESTRTLARDYVRSRIIWGEAPRRVGPLMKAVWDRVLPIQLPTLRDALARGEPVGFGPVRLSAEGLRVEGRDFARAETTRVSFELERYHRRRLREVLRVVDASGSVRREARVPAADVPNSTTLASWWWTESGI